MVSSILPRKEMKFRVIIQNMNDFLAGCCLWCSKMEFMFNINIKNFMLRDKKHLDDNAFIILLSNLKYFVFGKTPPVSIYRRYNMYLENV